MFVPSTREAIAELHAAGVKPAEIARQLGLAPTKVDYHLEQLLRPDRTQPEGAMPDDSGRPRRTREAVALLLNKGLSRAEVARQLGISKATVTYHAHGPGDGVDTRFAKRFDWAAIRRYYDEGHSVRECMRAFGFCSSAWSNAVRRGAVVPRPKATPISDLCVAGTYRSRDNLKLRLIKAGIKQNRCERCGLDQWRGRPVSMALHHINGERLDNRLENLELLCPNCHSQTDTYSGRNGHRRGPAHQGSVPQP